MFTHNNSANEGLTLLDKLFLSSLMVRFNHWCMIIVDKSYDMQ